MIAATALVAPLVATALLVSVTAHAQTPPAATSCKAQATEKKLHGAALTSFMKKCETDAQAACDASAAEKKLAGAAKASFTKKCVGDAVGQ
ncbi:PsiF family protein [Rhodoplanes azumiensis]|uniref:PsiF family protein n=1 Tax=Rhodoplanes azumiensis TaxID=1897628 RepID=A0ABW5AJM8_9BRAD